MICSLPAICVNRLAATVWMHQSLIIQNIDFFHKWKFWHGFCSKWTIFIVFSMKSYVLEDHIYYDCYVTELKFCICSVQKSSFMWSLSNLEPLNFVVTVSIIYECEIKRIKIILQEFLHQYFTVWKMHQAYDFKFCNLHFFLLDLKNY